MPQITYNKLLEEIDGGIEKFLSRIPAIEQMQYNKLLRLIKELDLDGDTIKNNLNNIKVVARIKKAMDELVLSDEYLSSSDEFMTTFDAVEALQQNYFSELSDKFKPKRVYGELKKIAIEDTVALLTEDGIGSVYSDEIKGLLTRYITTGGTYTDMVQSLKESILGTDKVEGKLTRYVKQITTDALNQYNGTLTKAVTDDLGLNWFVYVGSNIKTTREFCREMTKLKYFHRSEIKEILNGNIPNKSEKVSLAGLDDSTTPETFQALRGGFQCRHSIFPVSDAVVPQVAKDRVLVS